MWKPRTKLGTRQLLTPLVYDPDTELSILGSVPDEGFEYGHVFNVVVTKKYKIVEYTV